MAHKNALFLILTSFALAGPLGCAEEIPLEEYPSSLRNAYCDWAIGCGEYGDDTTCLDHLGADDSLFLTPDILNAIDNGSMVYDERQAAECMEALRGSSCSTFGFEDTQYSDVCERMFSGTLEGGQLCFLDEQCGSSWCDVDYDTCDDSCCAGSCISAPSGGGLGEPCVYNDCDDGNYCHWETETCQSRKGYAAPCNYSEECQSGWLCFGDPGVCDAPREEGQPCYEEECGRMGVTCDTTRSLCVSVQTLGEVCNPSVDLCGESLSCDSGTNTCASAPTIGEPCTYGCDYQTYCEWDEDYSEGVCEPRKSLGASCGYSEECLSYYCGDEGRCEQYPACVL